MLTNAIINIMLLVNCDGHDSRTEKNDDKDTWRFSENDEKGSECLWQRRWLNLNMMLDEAYDDHEHEWTCSWLAWDYDAEDDKDEDRHDYDH